MGQNEETEQYQMVEALTPSTKHQTSTLGAFQHSSSYYSDLPEATLCFLKESIFLASKYGQYVACKSTWHSFFVFNSFDGLQYVSTKG